MTVTNRTIWIAANTSWYLVKFRRPLIERLQESGYRVVTLAPADSYTPALEHLGVEHVSLKLRNANLNPVYEVATIARLLGIFRKRRPALLLTFTPKLNIYGGIAAGLCGIPFLANVSGLGRAFIHGGWLARVAGILYRLSFTRAEVVYFQNPDDRGLFEELGIVRMALTKLLPGSGVDVRAFSPPTERPATPHVTFLLVARLLRDKGVAEYIDAARVVSRARPGAKFQILGFIDPENPTSFLAGDIDTWKADGTIEYLGSTEDVRPVYANADCVVLPSYREGCPRVLLEAASMGLPVITTDVPGCRQVVEDGVTGFLVRVRDAGDLAEKMERMLMLSDEERAAMGRRGRQKMIKEYDERIVIDAYLRAVKEFALT